MQNNIVQLLATSNSALGHWANKTRRPEIEEHLRPTLAYGRYSTSGQNPLTLEKQQELIAAHCQAKGWREPRFFGDMAQRGVHDVRPAWTALLAAITPGSRVVVHEGTRLAREAFVFLKMMREVHSRGGLVELVTGNTNDTMYLTIMAAVAEYDYRSVATRLRDGRVQAIASGMPYRKPSYGYTGNGKEFRINEVEAHWVREMFRMRLAGSTIGEIVRFLVANKAPLRTAKGKWTVTRVNQILYNPLVGGYLVSKRPVFAWERHE